MLLTVLREPSGETHAIVRCCCCAAVHHNVVERAQHYLAILGA